MPARLHRHAPRPRTSNKQDYTPYGPSGKGVAGLLAGSVDRDGEGRWMSSWRFPGGVRSVPAYRGDDRLASQSAIATDRAQHGVDPGETFQDFLPGFAFAWFRRDRLGCPQPFPAAGQVFAAVAVRQQPVVPDAHETVRQHVQEIAADEL